MKVVFFSFTVSATPGETLTDDFAPPKCGAFRQKKCLVARPLDPLYPYDEISFDVSILCSNYTDIQGGRPYCASTE